MTAKPSLYAEDLAVMLRRFEQLPEALEYYAEVLRQHKNAESYEHTAGAYAEVAESVRQILLGKSPRLFSAEVSNHFELLDTER